MALTGPDCAKAVYGQVTMQFYGGNQIQEAPEAIVDALNLVASHPAGTGGPFALSIRVLDANGISLNCCPDGYVFDAAARTCVLKPVVVNPPPPSKPPPPPPAPPPVDAGGDELTVNFSLLFQYLIQLTELIKVLTQPQPGTSAETCCTHIIAALVSLTKVVQQIGVKLGQPGAPPPPAVDLSAVLTELQCVCTNLTAISQSSASVANDLGPGLQSIADAIVKGTDVRSIVEQLKKANELQDVDKTILRQMLLDKIIPGQYSAALQGSPASWVHAILQAAAEFSPIIGFLEHLAGDDADLVAGERKATQLVNAIAARFAKNVKAVGSMPTGGPPSDLAAGFKAFLKASDTLLRPIVKPLIDGLAASLLPSGGKLPEIGQIGVEAAGPVAAATGIALTAGIAAWALSFAGIDEGESLTHIAELIAGAIGWEELRDVEIRPLVQYGIERVAQFNAKRVFRQELPGVETLGALAARGLLPIDRYGQLAPLTGIPTELQGAVLEASEQGLAPFILLRLANTGLFTQSDLVDEMTFKGLRPASQHRILLAAPFLASQKERDALRATLEKAYAGGLFTDVDFTTRIGALEQETDRARLMLERGRIERGLFVLKEIENAYETEFLAGITDAPTYQSKLQGLGLQLDYVTGIMAKAEAHANARLLRQAAASERALQKATHAAERRAALEQFRTGTLNEAGLSAALVATGLTPIQVEAWVVQAAGQRVGTLQRVFGLQLSPPEAKLLRQRVADLTKQRELQMLSDSQYVQGLQALKIPPTWVNALRAGANAALKPKTAAILTPVTIT
jgi:hypothetical protein